MESYSADDIKRKKRKNHNTDKDVVLPTDGNNLIIPFTVSFRKENSFYIYDGKEKIPFKKRDPKFQELLRNEFE